jgi:hypothetical protein
VQKCKVSEWCAMVMVMVMIELNILLWYIYDMWNDVWIS